MRILYHAINGLGLGHLMRLSAIACAVRDKSPDVHQLFASSANYPQHFRRMAMPVIVLPQSDAGAATGIDRRSRTISSRLSVRILDDVIRQYNPQVVVFDTHVGNQLVRSVIGQGRQAVLIYRRCREPFIIKHLRDGLLEQFHRILVPHTEQQFRRNLPNSTMQRLIALGSVRFVGPIVFPATPDAEPRLDISPQEELVLIVGGGGGLDLMHRPVFLRACQAVSELRRERPNLRCVYVGGPFAGATELPEGCIFLQEEAELQLLMARAVLVIAIPGYNTVQEILQTGVRTLLVPMPRQQEDQEDRVAELVERGRASSLPASASVRQIRDAICAVLETSAPAPELQIGAANAAAELLCISAAPRKLIHGRESRSISSALRFSSLRKLALSLNQESHLASCLRLDWNRVEPLFLMLKDQARQAILSVEIVVGPCSPEEASERMRALCQMFHSIGFDHNRVLFAVDDPSAGRLLAELTRQVADLRFHALVARFSEQSLQIDPTAVFESLELCRKLGPRFKLDVTVADQQFAFVDQP